MTFISLFLLFLKALLLIPVFVVKLGLSLFGIGYYIYDYKKLPVPRSVCLDDYKIYSPIRTILVVGITTVGFISTMMTFKILNIGREVNLRLVCKKVIEYLSTTEYITIFVNGLLIIGIFLLSILILKKLRNFIFYEYIKVHIYLMGYTDSYPYKRYFNYYNVYGFMTGKDNMLQMKFYCVFSHDNPDYDDDWLLGTIENILKKIDENLHIILIIVSILYDILFNDLVLSKIYYIFPIAYLYILWQLFQKFITRKSPDVDIQLYTYLYKKPLAVSSNAELDKNYYYAEEGILYEDGTSFISIEDLNGIYLYVLRDFVLDTGNDFVLDTENAKDQVIINKKEKS
jgi:hypothetical protein